MAETPTLYCVDCLHYRPSDTFPDKSEYARCVAPENTTVGGPSLVEPGATTDDTYKVLFCALSRRMAMYCGPAAKWFDEKVVTNG